MLPYPITREEGSELPETVVFNSADVDTRTVRALRTVGPGIVFALTVLGPGDFVSNAVTGATQGYSLLWALVVAVAFRFIWLDASARYVLATGESLMDGYRRLSPVLVWAVFAAMLLVRTLSNLYKVVLLGNVAQLLIPVRVPGIRYVWGAGCCLLAYLICARGRYAALERLFKVLVALMWAALVVAVFLARPDPAAILHGLTFPLLPADDRHYTTLYLLLVLIGTEAGSMTNVTYAYFLGQKGWRGTADRGSQQRDLWLSVACLFTMGALVQITAAGTLKPAGLVPSGADDLVVLFTRTLGVAGRVIFTFGLCAAAVSGFIGGTTGYSLIASDIWKKMCGSGAEDASRRDHLYNRFVAYWSFAPLPLMALTDKPVWLVLAVSALMGVLIPVLAIALLRLSSNRARLGLLVAPLPLRAGLMVLTVVSSALIVMNAIQWWSGWKPAG